MAKINRYLMLILLLGMASPATALTGDDIYKKCTKAQKVPESEKNREAITRFLDVGTCAGFIGGVLSGVNLVGSMMMQKGMVKRNFICIPEKQHSQMLVNEVVGYLEENVEDRKLPAQVIIYKVFAKKYACKDEGL